MADTRRPGRPRSEEARVAVLDATKDLILEGGYDHLTINAIAQRANVGRQTVYRWWRTKSEIVSEAFLEGIIAFPAPPPVASGVHLNAWLRETLRPLADPEGASIVRALAAAAASDKNRSDALYDNFTRQSRDQIIAALQQAAEQRIVRSDVNLDVAADSIIGAVLFRILARQDFTDDYAGELLAPLLVTSRPARATGPE